METENKIYRGKTRNYSAKAQIDSVKNSRLKSKELGLSPLQITDLTEKDKTAFRQFKKDSGIDKNSDAFRKLLEIAKINDNQKYYII